MPRKYISGSKKRKRKEQSDQFMATQQGAMERYVRKIDSTSQDNVENIVDVDDNNNERDDDPMNDTENMAENEHETDTNNLNHGDFGNKEEFVW